MYYALIHLLDFDTTPIDRLRQKYDPTVSLIKPHITVLFPVPAETGESRIQTHIIKVLASRTAFRIRINGFKKSWDHWLLLTIKEGNDRIIKLHDDLYTGFLSPFRRRDITFVPHIGIGLFVKERSEYELGDPHRLNPDMAAYNRALKEVGPLDLDFDMMFRRLTLITLNEDFTQIEMGQEFQLRHG